MKKTINTILLLLILSAFVFFSFLLIQWYFAEMKNEALVSDIKKTSFSITDKDVADFYENSNLTCIETIEKEAERTKLFLAAQSLKDKNSDYIGWIQIPDSKIDYPVLQNEAIADYYLKRDFNKKKSAHGSIYLDRSCIVGYANNYVIYGHHMKDETMFADLDKYKSQDYYSKHDKIRFDTLYDMADYQVVSVISVPEQELNITSSFLLVETEEDFNEFKEFVEKYQLYETYRPFSYDDRYITLITCEYTYKNGRILVIAKKIN